MGSIHLCSLSCSEGSQRPCCEPPCGEAQEARNKRHLRSSAIKGLFPVTVRGNALCQSCETTDDWRLERCAKLSHSWILQPNPVSSKVLGNLVTQHVKTDTVTHNVFLLDPSHPPILFSSSSSTAAFSIPISQAGKLSKTQVDECERQE